MRFSLGDKPVILIREEHPDNRQPFDIRGLFIFPYSSKQYSKVQSHLISKLRDFEQDSESYRSPVLKVLAKDSQVINSVMRRQTRSLMRGLHEGLFACQELLRRRVVSLLPVEALQSADQSIFPREAWKMMSCLKSAQALRAAEYWVALSFVPPVIPAMVGFLSFYHLADAISPAVSEALFEKLHLLHYHYWAGAALTAQPLQETYVDFLHEIGKTFDAARFLEAYLSTENEAEKKNLEAKALKLLK
jgi:uncharacterized membrane protein YfbV (UPF0208 family)